MHRKNLHAPVHLCTHVNQALLASQRNVNLPNVVKPFLHLLIYICFCFCFCFFLNRKHIFRCKHMSVVQNTILGISKYRMGNRYVFSTCFVHLIYIIFSSFLADQTTELKVAQDKIKELETFVISQKAEVSNMIPAALY